MLAMPRAELRFRSTGLLRTAAQRIGSAMRRPGWTRHHLGRVLSQRALERVHSAMRRSDWHAVDRDLREMLSGRPPRFVLDPRAAPAIRAGITSRWPDAPAHAAAAGDAIAAGRFALLGFSNLSFALDGVSIDWHYDPVHRRSAPRRFAADIEYLDPAYGDHKIIWELNRHQHFLALGRAYWLTGDPRYADAIVAQFHSWLSSNPPLRGVNWASALELGLRSISWVWAMHFLLADKGPGQAGGAEARTPWLADMLVALDRQLTHVEQNLSYYFSPNTHLLGEALALYVVGTALPELRRSSHWASLGRKILLDGVDRQIARDGGHIERSTHYHRYTLDFYLLALSAAERSGDAQALEGFRNAVSRLAAFMLAFANEDGMIPLIGDDDGGMLWPIAGRDPRDVRDSLAVAAACLARPELSRWDAPEEATWIGWPHDARTSSVPEARDTDAVDTQVFPETGYVVIRTGRGDHLTFDVGLHGYLNAGHAHADALAVTLSIGGDPLLIDPGTGTYTTERATRDRMRGSASHNTVTLDGRSSAIPGGPFHWQSRADGSLAAWRRSTGFAWAEGFHDGYAPARHRRSIVFGTNQGWLVVDEVLDAAQPLIETHWQFGPKWHVGIDGRGRVKASRAQGEPVWLVTDGGDMTIHRADAAAGLGWYSPRYGVIEPTFAVRVVKGAAAASGGATWIGTGNGEGPSLERIDVSADSESPAVAVRVNHGAVRSVTLLRPGDVAERRSRSCDTADYHTNGRVLQYGVTGSDALRLSLVDGTHALALHDRLLSVGADRHLPDLHVSIQGQCLQLFASKPPDQLHVRGRALQHVRRVTLNGREPRERAPFEADAFTFMAGDWGPAHAGCSFTRAEAGPRIGDSERNGFDGMAGAATGSRPMAVDGAR